MAKTNFTKVEEALNEGLRKMEVGKLLGQTEDKKAAERETTAPKKLTNEQFALVTKLQIELKYLKRAGLDPFEKLKINKSELKKMLLGATELGPQEWDKLKKYKEQLDGFRKEQEKTVTDDSAVEQERRKHVNKRFNINNDWLPLQ